MAGYFHPATREFNLTTFKTECLTWHCWHAGSLNMEYSITNYVTTLKGSFSRITRSFSFDSHMMFFGRFL